jgi:hypothetical protein
MIDTFEAPTHFKTYNLESTESFSANCNVLIAILSSENLSTYLPQISKALSFLCQVWYNGKLSDKWVRTAIQTKIVFANQAAESGTTIFDDAPCRSFDSCPEAMG